MKPIGCAVRRRPRLCSRCFLRYMHIGTGMNLIKPIFDDALAKESDDDVDFIIYLHTKDKGSWSVEAMSRICLMLLILC